MQLHLVLAYKDLKNDSLCQSAVLSVLRLRLGTTQWRDPATARRYGTLGRQAGEYQGGVAAAPQQPAKGQRHTGPTGHWRLASLLICI